MWTCAGHHGTDLETGLAAYFYAMELRGMEIEDSLRSKQTTPQWYMRSDFCLVYHILVFGAPLSKSSVAGRIYRLDSCNGSDQKYPEHRPTVRIVEDLPHV